LKRIIFWGLTQRSRLEVYRYFVGMSCLHLQGRRHSKELATCMHQAECCFLVYSSTPNRETVLSFKRRRNMCQVTRRKGTQDNIISSHRSENLRSLYHYEIHPLISKVLRLIFSNSDILYNGRIEGLWHTRFIAYLKGHFDNTHSPRLTYVSHSDYQPSAYKLHVRTCEALTLEQ
jgi:hypothetical protein